MSDRDKYAPRGYTISDYRKCAEAGMDAKETAEALGVTRASVYHQARKNGLKFKGMAPPRPRRKAADRPVSNLKRDTPRRAEGIKAQPRADLTGQAIEKIHRMHEVGHPPGVIEMVTGISRGQVVEVLDV